MKWKSMLIFALAAGLAWGRPGFGYNHAEWQRYRRCIRCSSQGGAAPVLAVAAPVLAAADQVADPHHDLRRLLWRPSSRPSSPSTRPSTRPSSGSVKPSTRPSTRPSSGTSTRPSSGTSKKPSSGLRQWCRRSATQGTEQDYIQAPLLPPRPVTPPRVARL